MTEKTSHKCYTCYLVIWLSDMAEDHQPSADILLVIWLFGYLIIWLFVVAKCHKPSSGARNMLDNMSKMSCSPEIQTI